MNIIYQYAVKIVCGRSEGRVTAPGRYWTAVNIHNPSYQSVKFRKKVAVGLPGCKAGPISEFKSAKLGPDEAAEVDCEDIFNMIDSQEFVKGFLVIQSENELDVVAVYTAAGADEQLETFHTERVKPRRIEIGLPDLIPVPDESGNFCKTQDNRTLIVTVMNKGNAAAGPSATRVDFGNYGSTDRPTPALAVGASVDLDFPIPAGCFDPDCEFRIIVDVNGQVTESDEGNNFAGGVCRG